MTYTKLIERLRAEAVHPSVTVQMRLIAMEAADAIEALQGESGQLHASLQSARTAFEQVCKHRDALAAELAGELTDKIISLPVPASASDLKSDIVELIQSHKYKGLRSIEVLGVFQFIGAEIISGSNS